LVRPYKKAGCRDLSGSTSYKLRSDNSNNEMSVNLTNLGLGTAVITSIKFYRDNDVNSSVYDPYKLINFPYDFYTWKFAENVTYMRPGEIIVMAKITSAP